MTTERPVAAGLAVLLAMVVIGFVDNYVVVIAETGGLWQFQILRTAIALPLILALPLIGLGALAPSSWRWVGLRSLVVSSAMMIYFGSLAFLPIAESAAGLFTSPIFVLLISVMCLGMRVGRVRTLSALVGFAGVVMVLKPDAGGVSVATFVPVLAGLLYAIGAVITRERCARDSAVAIVAGNFLAFAVWGALALAILAALDPTVPPGVDGFVLRGWVPATPPFLFWTAVNAVGSVTAVLLLVRGYQMADTSFVAVFEFSLLIFVSLWAFALRGEVPDIWGIVGIALIVGSGVAIVLRGR